MFEKNEYIVYGVTGVCRVKDISPLEGTGMRGANQERLYYFLQPVHAKGEKIFTPVDNQKIPMRRVLSKEEASRLLDLMPGIEELWVDNEKLREASYKTAIKSCDCREWIRVIKALYLRKQERTSLGKKLTTVDERYFQKAKENLYSELAVSLDMNEDEVEDYIINRLDQA